MKKADVAIQIRLEMLHEMIEHKMEMLGHMGMTREQASHEAYMDLMSGKCKKEFNRRFKAQWSKFYQPRVKKKQPLFKPERGSKWYERI